MLAKAATFTDAAGAGAVDPPDLGIGAGAAAAASTGAGPAQDIPSADALLSGLPDQASIEEMLRQATFEDPGASGADMSQSGFASGSVAASVDADPFNLPNFNQVIQDAQVSSIDLLRDVELNVKIELGRSRMLVEDVLRLAEGSVVELDKLAGDPVDVFVNERLVARGEVLVLNDNFCVRVNEIVAAAKDEGL
ncbi:flagellar motor switch protein FliN [Humisphaera borealis]|nr:flagellar motor switch protein FliN [Humisphaera borealis]